MEQIGSLHKSSMPQDLRSFFLCPTFPLAWLFSFLELDTSTSLTTALISWQERSLAPVPRGLDSDGIIRNYQIM